MIEKFCGILRENGLMVTVRRELGNDINASCGSRLDTNGSSGGTFGSFTYTAGDATSSPTWEWKPNP